MQSKLVGKWKLTTSQNFNEFLKTLDVGYIVRHALNLSKPVVEISNEGINWRIKVSGFMDKELNFTEGELFKETDFAGRITRSVVRIKDPDTMVQALKYTDFECVIERQVTEDDLLVQVIQTLKLNNQLLDFFTDERYSLDHDSWQCRLQARVHEVFLDPSRFIISRGQPKRVIVKLHICIKDLIQVYQSYDEEN